MMKISEGAEVLLKTGEYVTVTGGFDSWRGQRWTGKGRSGGKNFEREFGDDDVRAVLGEGRGLTDRTPSTDSESASLF